MEQTLDIIHAHYILRQMLLISSYCAHACRESNDCSSDRMGEVSDTVNTVFIALVFAKLKHIHAHSLYVALTTEFQKIVPDIFEIDGQNATEDMALNSVRRFEEWLYDQLNGEVLGHSLRDVFNDMNKARVDDMLAAYGDGPCRVGLIQKVLLNHYGETCRMIDAIED